MATGHIWLTSRHIGKSLPQVWAECISELLTISSEIIAINNQFRPQVASINNLPKPPDLSSMDWEPIKSTTTGTKQIDERRAKWVKKETLAFRKKNKLCVRCGHTGHIPSNCSLLPPLNPNVRVNKASTLEEDERVLLKMAESEEINES